tara:strand:+ start:6208 stop:7782 length:1575 start_codon:yes stop_codon:yes gene_type:complete
MKKLLLLLITSFTIISCSETEEAKRIQWTSSSPEAIQLFEEMLVMSEKNEWYPEKFESLMDSIKVLDPDFVFSKTRDGFGTNLENRSNLLYAYENRSKASDIEARLIESYYERNINQNRNKEVEILDALIEDYPEYYQLRIWSGDLKNGLNEIKAGQKRWEEALVINPKSFAAHVSLAFLHVPTGNTNMLAVDERDLDVAKDYLIKGSKMYPKSSRWSRYLGNVYRAEGDFDKSLASYQESLGIIEKFEAGSESNSYANSLLMVGHVNTFTGEYDKAREYYDKGIAISNNNWIVSMSVLKSQTYMYEKDFASAIYTLSELQSVIKTMDDEEEIRRINFTDRAEFMKFLAFGHSQKEEETILSMKKMDDLENSRLKIRLENAINDDQKERITLGAKKSKMGVEIWYNILFGKYEEARVLLTEFKPISETQLSSNPNAMNEYYKFSGYLNLMEGDPEESIKSYSNLSDEVMSGDSYHVYFLALAKKAVGEVEESNLILSELANDNFATWQNSIVKNLAKSQIKVNI